MGLFDLHINDAAVGYQNIRDGCGEWHLAAHKTLNDMWEIYKPYADANFLVEFARQPDPRFWEMYLTVQLLREGKNICCRADLPPSKDNSGPDIKIIERESTIWIEAIAPGPGNATNADRIPDLVPYTEGAVAQTVPVSQVELRITTALSKKKEQFEYYYQKGLIGENDVCIVAISGGQFYNRAGTTRLSRAVYAVYPLGKEYVAIDPKTGDAVDSGYQTSFEIDRELATPIPRTAFLDDHFRRMSGIIWSRRGIGNFLGQQHDFSFVHNHVAQNPFPLGWLQWKEEFVVNEDGSKIENIVRS